MHQERQRRLIIEWLGAPDPSSRLNDAQKLRMPNTGDWFLKNDAFDLWKSTPRSIFWIYGIPGCGKTVLCSSIIEDLSELCHPDTGTLVAYFFFDFTTQDKQIVGLLLRSLLSQIMVQNQGILEPVQSLFTRNRGGFQRPGSKVLLSILHSILKAAGETYLILDALDECSERAELLEVLREIVEWGLENLHISVTSRGEKDIEEALIGLHSAQFRLEGKGVNEDIREYVHRTILKDTRLKKWPAEVQTEITSLLTGKAGEMFRWATCQLDALRKCIKLEQLRNTLNSLPRTLDDTYLGILSKIDPEFTHDAIRILSWLCFAFRPPTLSEVAEALAINLESSKYDTTQRIQDAKDILYICGSLVTKSSDFGGVLKLSHYSVKEYLTSSRILQSDQSEYYISEQAAGIFIAKTCLIYLHQFDFSSHAEADAARTDHVLIQYSTDFWSEHFKRAEQAPELLSLAIDLLDETKSSFLNWAWFAGIVPDGFYTETPRWTSQTRNSTILYYAVLIGSLDLIKAALDRGPDVHAEGGVFGTALTLAAYKGDATIVQLLLSSGAEVNYQAGIFGNALQASAYWGWVEIVALLISHGAK
ncbi:hypothetical protein K469DRAFT_610300, partial [Zopfia rhizophila CBS 207.26]